MLWFTICAVCDILDRKWVAAYVLGKESWAKLSLWRWSPTTEEASVFFNLPIKICNSIRLLWHRSLQEKTADQAKGLHPEAAQVLKNNTYMDDICDSLHSVQQAKQLTTEQDEVLLKGGFQIKGWLSNQSLENGIIRPENSEMELLQGAT